MINLAIQAGGPPSRTGLPVQKEKQPTPRHISKKTRPDTREEGLNSRSETRIMVDS
jgi:hypothetical protein